MLDAIFMINIIEYIDYRVVCNFLLRKISYRLK